MHIKNGVLYKITNKRQSGRKATVVSMTPQAYKTNNLRSTFSSCYDNIQTSS